MKRILLNSLVATFFLSLAVLTACKKDDGGTSDMESEEQKQLKKLTGTWNFADITVGDAAPVGDWNSFTVTFGGTSNDDKKVSGTYEAGGTWPDDATPVWKKGAGTWAFGSDVNTIVRDDEVNMSVTVNDAGTELTLTFTINTAGREESVDGNWKFVGTK